MPLPKKPTCILTCELLRDPYCRSGYNYATQRHQLWKDSTPEDLKNIACAFLELYGRTNNKHSFGIAIYLQQLLAKNLVRA